MESSAWTPQNRNRIRNRPYAVSVSASESESESESVTMADREGLGVTVAVESPVEFPVESPASPAETLRKSQGRPGLALNHAGGEGEGRRRTTSEKWQ